MFSSSSEDVDDEEDVAILNTAVAAVTQYMQENSSDEEDLSWGGSEVGKSSNAERDFIGAYEQVTRHYFSGDDSLYDEETF